MTQDGGGTRLPARIESGHELAPDRDRRAVATLETYAPAPAPPPLQEYLGLFQRRRKAILMGLGAVMGLSILVTAVTPRTYEATATLLISEAPKGSSSDSSDDRTSPPMAAMGSPNLDTHVQLITGESTAEQTAAWLKENGGPALRVEEIRTRMTTRSIRDTQLIRISARARQTEEARKLANALAATYVRMNRDRARGTSETTGRYLSEQLAIAKRNLTQAENELRAFKEASGIVAQDAEASELLSRAAKLRGDADVTGADLAQARERSRKIRAQLAEQNMSITSGHVRDNAVVQQLRARLAELQGQRLAAQAKYTSQYQGPIAQIDEQIALVTKQLEEEVRHLVKGGGGDLELQQSLTAELIQAEAQAAALRARHGQLSSQLARANQELGRVPSRQISLAGLQRQVDVAQSIYSELLRKSQEVEVGRVMALGNADIVEAASLPRLPVRPNVPLNLVLGLLLGLGVGLGVALIQDQLDGTLRDQAEAARLVEAPVLGTIPVFPTNGETGLLPAGGAQAVEAYRALRYCLDFLTQGGTGRVVLVTSAAPFEGKSTTVLNLARAVALTGKRVILVDTDLRRSGLGRMLGVNGLKGVTEVLLGEVELGPALHHFPDSGLTFLSSGKLVENPTELLDSSKMKEMVSELRREADLIIMDSPPVLAVADSLVLANLSDAVLMVCVAGQSQRYELQLARTLLSRVGESISGVVLNKSGEKSGYGYHGRYYYQ